MQKDHLKKCALFMALSSFSFSLMGLLLKIGAKEIPESILIFFRSAVMLVFVNFIIDSKDRFKVPQHFKSILLRSTVGSMSIYFYAHSISKLELSRAILLSSTSPLFVALISFIYLKEKMNRMSFFSLLLSIFGIFLITNPFSHSSLRPAPIGVFYGLMSAFCAGIAYTTLRSISGKVNSHLLVFYFSLISSLIALPAALIDWPNLHLKAVHYGILLCIGFFGFLGQTFMTKGYQFAKASIASSFGLMTVLFSTFWGMIFLNETFTLQRGIGMVFVISGVIFISYFQQTRTTTPPLGLQKL